MLFSQRIVGYVEEPSSIALLCVEVSIHSFIYSFVRSFVHPFSQAVRLPFMDPFSLVCDSDSPWQRLLRVEKDVI